MQKRTKILFYTDTPLLGGAEHQMFLLAQFLDKEKYEVILACSTYPQLDSWCKKWLHEGFKVYTFHVNHKHDPRHYFQFKRLLKKEKPNLVHLHLWNPGACRYAFKALKKLPVVTTEHDPFPLKGIKNKLKKRTFKKITHTIAISDANKALLIKEHPELKEKVTTIHNGIDTTWLESQTLSLTDQARTKIRQNTFQADDETTVIFTAATLHPRKGLTTLIKAAEHFQEQNYRFIIAGEGPQRKELESLIKKLQLEHIVHLIGHQKKIPHLLKSSDIFILPSKKEAFGLAILEAMTAKIPVIATKAGGVPEIITHKKNGLLVAPGNPESIIHAIEEISNNSDLRDTLINNAYHTAKEKFDAKIMAKNTESVYEGALKKF